MNKKKIFQLTYVISTIISSNENFKRFSELTHEIGLKYNLEFNSSSRENIIKIKIFGTLSSLKKYEKIIEEYMINGGENKKTEFIVNFKKIKEKEKT